MNKQELFDKIVVHLRQQGKRSLDARGYCVYRGDDNTKCAFGCLIDDLEYRPEMENKCLGELCRSNLYGLKRYHVYVSFLGQMQYIHDNDPLRYWEENFNLVYSSEL